MSEDWVYLETDEDLYARLRFKYSPLGRFYRWKFRQQLSARKKFIFRGLAIGAFGGVGLVFLLRFAGSYPLLFVALVILVAILHKRGVINVRFLARRVLNGSDIPKVR